MGFLDGFKTMADVRGSIRRNELAEAEFDANERDRAARLGLAQLQDKREQSLADSRLLTDKQARDNDNTRLGLDQQKTNEIINTQRVQRRQLTALANAAEAEHEAMLKNNAYTAQAQTFVAQRDKARAEADKFMLETRNLGGKDLYTKVTDVLGSPSAPGFMSNPESFDRLTKMFRDVPELERDLWGEGRHYVSHIYDPSTDMLTVTLYNRNTNSVGAETVDADNKPTSVVKQYKLSELSKDIGMRSQMYGASKSQVQLDQERATREAAMTLPENQKALGVVSAGEKQVGQLSNALQQNIADINQTEKNTVKMAGDAAATVRRTAAVIGDDGADLSSQIETDISKVANSDITGDALDRWAFSYARKQLFAKRDTMDKKSFDAELRALDSTPDHIHTKMLVNSVNRLRSVSQQQQALGQLRERNTALNNEITATAGTTSKAINTLDARQSRLGLAYQTGDQNMIDATVQSGGRTMFAAPKLSEGAINRIVAENNDIFSATVDSVAAKLLGADSNKDSLNKNKALLRGEMQAFLGNREALFDAALDPDVSNWGPADWRLFASSAISLGKRAKEGGFYIDTGGDRAVPAN